MQVQKRNRIKKKKKDDDFFDYKGLTKSINGMTYCRLSASLLERDLSVGFRQISRT